MKDILKAVYDRAVAVDNFYDALSNQFYLNSAPQGISKPYAVFQLITNTTDFNFTSTFDEAEIQIDIIDVNTSSNILDLADKCMTDFDDCTLTVAGHQFLKMERELNFLTEDADEQIQRYMIQYMVWTRK